MIFGFLSGIAVAYLFTYLHVDHIIISGVQNLVKIDIGPSGYYLLMGLVGGISRVMIGGFISGLVVAYLFTFVKLDSLIIEGVKELFKTTINTGGYYLLFAIIGAALSFLEVVRTILRPLSFSIKKMLNK
jgi:hypothetical protein